MKQLRDVFLQCRNDVTSSLPYTETQSVLVYLGNPANPFVGFSSRTLDSCPADCIASKQAAKQPDEAAEQAGK